MEESMQVEEFSAGASGKESICQCRRHKTLVWSLGWEDPLKRAWRPTPVFLPGESHIQSNLAGYSPWDCEESDMTEAT